MASSLLVILSVLKRGRLKELFTVVLGLAVVVVVLVVVVRGAMVVRPLNEVLVGDLNV